MTDQDAGTPRVFICRHGETTWSKSGQYTGTTDLPLLPSGRAQVTTTATHLVGPHSLIRPARLAHILVSPRLRARETATLLFGDDAAMRIDPRLAEWDYGAYEGLLTREIRAARAGRGLDGERPWDIWRDGCEGGESPAEVSARLDEVIKEVRAEQGKVMRGEGGGEGRADVVVVAHGHILRAFVKRWLGYPLEFPLSLMLEPGGVGVLSYQHHNVDEPALMVGLGFPTQE